VSAFHQLIARLRGQPVPMDDEDAAKADPSAMTQLRDVPEVSAPFPETPADAGTTRYQQALTAGEPNPVGEANRVMVDAGAQAGKVPADMSWPPDVTSGLPPRVARAAPPLPRPSPRIVVGQAAPSPALRPFEQIRVPVEHMEAVRTAATAIKGGGPSTDSQTASGEDKMTAAMRHAEEIATRNTNLANLGDQFSRAADTIGRTPHSEEAYRLSLEQAGEPVKAAERQRKAVEDDLRQKYERGYKDQELSLRKSELDRKSVEDKTQNEDRDLNRKRLELDAAAARGDKEAARALQWQIAQLAHSDKLELKHGQTLDRETQALEKRLPGETAGMLQKLDRLKTEIPATGDIPGVGPIDRLRPDMLTSEAGQHVRQDVSGVVADLLRMQSGKTVSEQEVQRKLTELGLGGNQPDKMFRRGLDNLRSEIKATMTSKQAGFSPDAVDEFRRRGGITAADLSTDRAAPPSNMVPMMSPDGKPMKVLAAKVAAAQAKGWKLR
jgi:hypothetical protein